MKLRNILLSIVVCGLVGPVIAARESTKKPGGDVEKSDASKRHETEGHLQSIATALNFYKVNAALFPSTAQGLKALVEKPITDPVPRRWAMILPKVPTDAWQSPFRYRFPGAKDPNEFELSSNGPDRIAGTADDIIYQKAIER